MSLTFFLHFQNKARHTIPQEAEVGESGVQGQPQPVGNKPGLYKTLSQKREKKKNQEGAEETAQLTSKST